MKNQFKENIGKVLISQGFCKERTIGTFLKNHSVKINGQPVKNRTHLVDSEFDDIEIDDNHLEKIQHLYVMINKPAGYVCSTVSDRHPTVFDLLDELKKEENWNQLHCVGRVDSETTGLLLLTTNGAFSHFLTEPENNIEKSYYVKLQNKVSVEEQKCYIEKCKTGIEVDEEKKSPAFIAKPGLLEWLSDDQCIITFTEGKFHEVRRIFLKLGNMVADLQRISMNNIKLDEKLNPGEYKLLKRKEIEE